MAQEEVTLPYRPKHVCGHAWTVYRVESGLGFAALTVYTCGTCRHSWKAIGLPRIEFSRSHILDHLKRIQDDKNR